jgi:mono/diheme cytochrome c family protein
MRSFVYGIIVTLLVIAAVGFGAALLGMVPTQANVTPPKYERQIAMSALDASMERHAPRVNSPVTPTDENLIDGIKIYTMNCALCHGGIDRKPSQLGHSFYPPAPQVIIDPLDDPEWHVFYAVRTGVRYTGMPSWEKVLSEQDMWKVTAFLTRIEKLPPAVQEFWKKSGGAEVPAGAHEEHEDHHH